IREADRLDELIDDFFDKSYGSARLPMQEFYLLTEAGNKALLSSDLIGRMYRSLAAAVNLTKDPAVLARIQDQILYTRYVEQFREYNFTEGPQRQTLFEELLRFTYRVKNTGMGHTMAVWRGLPYYHQRAVKLPPNVGYEIPESQDPL